MIDSTFTISNGQGVSTVATLNLPESILPGDEIKLNGILYRIKYRQWGVVSSSGSPAQVSIKYLVERC